MLGLYRVDVPQKTVELRLNELPLDWCEGTLPTADGPIHLRWWKDGDKLAYRIDTPPGFRVEVHNLSHHALAP